MNWRRPLGPTLSAMTSDIIDDRLIGALHVRALTRAGLDHDAAEEHTVVNNAPNWKIGDVVQLIPSHACTTCNLHRELVVHENNHVVEIWPIEASGQLR